MPEPLLVTLPQNGSGEPPGMPESDFSGAGDAAEDLEYAVNELAAHAPGYEVARLYANGESPEMFFVSEAARGQVQQMINAFRFNFAGVVIKTVLDRLSILDFTDIDPSVVEEIVDANKLWQWSGQSIRETLIDGDHYVICREGDDGQPPILIPSSATETRIFYDGETERTAELAIRQWQMRVDGKTVTRVNLWYPDRVERFIKPKDGSWVRYSSDDLEPEEGHNFGQVPVAHWRTGFPYGTPVHKDAYGPQDAIVKAVMTLMASTEFEGWNQRYELHKLAQAGQSVLPGKTPDGQAPRLRTGPGTIMSLYADSVGTFDSADLSKLIGVVEVSVRSMAQITQTPMDYFDPRGARQSGESRAMADAPLKAKAGTQRRSIGSGAGHTMELAAIAMGEAPDQVSTVWAPDPIIGDADWWETAKVRNELGVSRKQIFIEAGYTEDQIKTFDTGTPIPQPNPADDA